MNRTGEKGSWDFGALKIELEQLILEDAPLEITGFSLTEIDQILLDEEASVVEAGPLAPEPDAIPIARIGDHFILGDHEVICGDATDPRVLAALMGDQEARLLLTDEPYNRRRQGPHAWKLGTALRYPAAPFHRALVLHIAAPKTILETSDAQNAIAAASSPYHVRQAEIASALPSPQIA